MSGTIPQTHFLSHCAAQWELQCVDKAGREPCIYAAPFAMAARLCLEYLNDTASSLVPQTSRAVLLSGCFAVGESVDRPVP